MKELMSLKPVAQRYDFDVQHVCTSRRVMSQRTSLIKSVFDETE